MQRRWSALRKWVIFPVTEMSFRWWTRGPNRTIFSVARVNDAIQPRVPWQRARHLPLCHIFRRGVTPCLITQPGWLSPVASTTSTTHCRFGCVWESVSMAVRQSSSWNATSRTLLYNKPCLSILARGNDSRKLPNKGKALIFPKHSCFNCLYLLREINFEREGTQMCMNKLLDKPISQFNSWELFL